MSDYTKTTNFTTKDSTNDTILGAEHDDEYDAIAIAIASKVDDGANSTITSLTGLTTPLSVAQGGTASATASAARTALGAAASGANGDITSLTALTNITASPVTVATDDKVVIQDTSASNVLKTVTAQSIADLVSVSAASTTAAGIVEQATDAEAIAFTDNKFPDCGNIQAMFNATGSAPFFACRAWVNFDGTTNSNVSGTYSQSGTTVTVTLTGHGHIVGHMIYSNITSGTGVDGEYTVATVTDENTFTYTAGTSLTTSGNITLNRCTIRGSGNVASVSDFAAGQYWVNFATAMPDVNYSISIASNPKLQASYIVDMGISPYGGATYDPVTTGFGIASGGTTDAIAICATVVR